MTDMSQQTIYQVQLSTGEVHAVVRNSAAAPTSMDYDPVEKYIYWVGGASSNRVWRTSIDGAQTAEIFDTGNLGGVWLRINLDLFSKSI